MGRRKKDSPRITIRINAADKELLDEMAEVDGTTISEICRHWISDRARVVRCQEDNAKAVKIMEGFLGSVQEHMMEKGIPPQQMAEIFGMSDEDDEEAPSPARHSNTGHKGSHLSPPPHPQRGQKR